MLLANPRGAMDSHGQVSFFERLCMFSIKRLQLSQKLPAAIIALSLVSALGVAAVSFKQAQSIVYEQSQDRLTAIAETASYEVTSWLSGIKGNLVTESESPLVRNAIKAFTLGWDRIDGNPTETLQGLYTTRNPFPMGEKHKLDTADDGSRYSATHAKYHPYFRALMEEKGYYDIFLFDTAGNLVYSVYKEPDFATNIVNGQWSGSDLGAAFRAARDSGPRDRVSFFDFKPYGPSNGAPASFVSRPIYDDKGVQLGVLAFQMPVNKLNEIFNRPASRDKQTYLFAVGKDGLLRSDTIATAEDDILNTSMDVSGHNGDGLMSLTGLSGAEVYAANLPIQNSDMAWNIVVTQDAETLLAPVTSLRNAIAWPLLIALALAAIMGFLIARTIVQPIRRLGDAIESVADGNLSEAVDGQNRGDEIGGISLQLDKLRLNLASAEAKREDAARQTAELQAAQTMVVNHLSVGLGKLAEGDLSARLHEPFAHENEKLRADFNRAMEQLQDLIHGIVGHVTTIKGGAGELSRAADDLSRTRRITTSPIRRTMRAAAPPSCPKRSMP